MAQDHMPQPKSDYTAKDYMDEFYPRKRRSRWLHMLYVVIVSLMLVGSAALGLFVLYALFIDVGG